MWNASGRVKNPCSSGTAQAACCCGCGCAGRGGTTPAWRHYIGYAPSGYTHGAHRILDSRASSFGLSFRSPFLTSLEQAERPSEIPCTAIYSRTDNIIVPEQGMLPPKMLGWNVRATTVPASHLWLLWHKTVCHQVIEELESIISSTDPRS